jgi:hypothetical protein
MSADEEVPVFATDVAVKVTGRSPAGKFAGAVYVVCAPLAVVAGETVPHGAVGHETLQLTPMLVGSFVTVAENCAVVPIVTVAEEGATTITRPEIVMFAEPVFVVSVTEVARTVIGVSAVGGVAGAV